HTRFSRDWSSDVCSSDLRVLKQRGAGAVYAMVTHGVFAAGSQERIDAAPIERLFVTDTVETAPVTVSKKVETVSVAPLFAEAIQIGRAACRERAEESGGG